MKRSCVSEMLLVVLLELLPFMVVSNESEMPEVLAMVVTRFQGSWSLLTDGQGLEQHRFCCIHGFYVVLI